MDVREKLVEMLNNSFAEQYEKRGLLTAPHTAIDLTAQGVTVQEWISVNDRLPELFTSVLTYVPSEAPLPLVHESYLADHDLWVCILERRPWKQGAVTHWMPLPQPPKGE